MADRDQSNAGSQGAQIFNFLSPGLDTSISPALEIKLGDVTADAPPSAIFGKAKSALQRSNNGLTTDYQIRSYYIGDHHRYMMGVTSPDDFPAVVQLAAKTLLWVCDWTACKIGDHPDVPNPAPSAVSKWVLLDEMPETYPIMTTQDGENGVYRISGTYVYGCLRPDRSTLKDVVFPIGPWIKSVFNRTIKDNLIKQGLIDIGQGQAQSSNNQQTRG